jgi:hypothetical protein
MKYLKCEDGKGLYTIDGTKWIQIDQINRDDLLALINIALKEEYEYEEYNGKSILNAAQQIVFKHIYERLLEVNANKIKFHEETESLYKEAIDKYTIVDKKTN